MRIAVSGTHYSGKSTLIEDLTEVLAKYVSVEEPYYLMEEEGYEFMATPSLEDFEQQLIRSLELFKGDEEKIIFDRCPIDFIAYSLSHPDSDSFDLEEWLPKIEAALETLDLIVFVPVEPRDRIFVPRTENLDFRLDVDEKLKEIFLENTLDLDVEILEVSGDRVRRRDQVLAHLTRLPSV